MFVPGSSVNTIDMQGDRVVGGVQFRADYAVGAGNQLTVLSGQIEVDGGVIGRVDAHLTAETVAATLRKMGEGTLLVDGNSTRMVVLEGTLGGNGSVDVLKIFDGGRLGPGVSIGEFRAVTYEQRTGGTLEIELASATENDLLSVSGPALIAGTLRIVPDGYLDPNLRGVVDDFLVLTAVDVEGEFEEVIYDGIELTTGDELGSFQTHTGNGMFRGVIYDDLSVKAYNYFALGGDANGDFFVDGLDFVIWNNNKFSGATDWTTGDFNGDGMTDGLDFVIWNDNKFTSVSPPAQVPEPASCLICLVLAAVASVARRRE